MRGKKYFLFVLLFVVCSISGVKAQQNLGYTTETRDNSFINHTVKTGETLYSIAVLYSTKVEEIQKLNPETDKGIYIGQVLRIPRVIVLKENAKTSSEVSAYTFEHTIEVKETLFSVSQKYNITVAELLKANPDLSEATFRIGREILIPDIYAESRNNNAVISSISTSLYSIEHKVEKQETLYSISKKYECTIQELLKLNPSIGETGLREGMTIYIPKGDVDKSFEEGLYVGTNQLDNVPISYYLPQDGVVRVALLLPFTNGSKSKSVSVEKIREYYEGFLLAVQRMKERGLNAEVYTFEIGPDDDTKRLESILGTNEINGLNLIIGGVSDKQVQLISRFSQKTGIKYVVPFSNKGTGVEYNANIFQVANSHASLYDKIVKEFIRKFSNYNIVFLGEVGSDNNKKDFTDVLQKGLTQAGVSFRIAPATPNMIDDLKSTLDGIKKNIIIPTSSSEISLKRILPVLDVLKRGTSDVSLFGYPDWQAYVNKKSKLYSHNSYLYGMFYLDDRDPEVQLFADRYKQWYNKNFLVSYPKFAHMGYDTGIVFLTALQKLGHDFSPRMNSLNTKTLQSALYFEPLTVKGGYTNTGMFIVNLKPDGSVEKTEIKE